MWTFDYVKKMEWKPLLLKDKQLLDQLLRDDQLSLSDYTFTNLWIWNISRKYQSALVDGFLCIKFDYEGKQTYLHPIGRGNKRPIIEKLLASEPFLRMRAVPENALSELQNLPLNIQEETAHFDYIYAFQDLLHLHGDRFQPKRNFIHQFERNYIYEYRQITPDLIPKIVEAEIAWFNEHPSPSGGMLFEHEGILNALKDYSALQTYGGALIVENRVIAYSIAEYLSKEMLVVHLEKCLKEFKGGYAMINQQMLKHLKEVPFINREEDLGLDNLTKVKASYHPIRLEKKFLLTKV